jgi:hypothetical protein
MTSTKITVSLTLDTLTPTPNDISNAVRRALTQPTLKDVPVSTNPDNPPLSTKGVTVRARAVTKSPNYKPKNPTIPLIREFAAKNNITVGKRGRISKEVREAYEASLNA